MPPKVQKSKAAKLLAAQSSSKGKGKKKWSKGKMREKKNNRVIFNKVLLDKIMKEVPNKMKVITVYSLIENYKINGSLARRTMKELASKGKIIAVSSSGKMPIYTKKESAQPEEKGKGKK